MNKVEVYKYVESGDKIKKVVTGYAEIISRDTTEFKDTTKMPEDIMKPLVCREFCDKNKNCKLINNGFADLCKYHDKHGIVVKRKPNQVIQYQREITEPDLVKSITGSMLRDDVMVPEIARAAPGIEERPLKWEQYSYSVYVCSYDDISEEKPVIEHTRKQQKVWSNKKEEKRREKFADNHGFKLKQKLHDLQFRNPEKAKEYASKLTINDWKSIDAIGGLRSPV